LKHTDRAQLLQVARLIEARAATGARRQIFFVQLGSFDTHNDQLRRQQNLFADSRRPLKAFYDATVALGVASQVTTFTLSDFGRTMQPASGGGTDPRGGAITSSWGRRPRRRYLWDLSAIDAGRAERRREGRPLDSDESPSTSTARRSRAGLASRRASSAQFSRICTGFSQPTSASWRHSASRRAGRPAPRLSGRRHTVVPYGPATAFLALRPRL